MNIRKILLVFSVISDFLMRFMCLLIRFSKALRKKIKIELLIVFVYFKPELDSLRSILEKQQGT